MEPPNLEMLKIISNFNYLSNIIGFDLKAGGVGSEDVQVGSGLEAP